ncbi:MAG: thymidine kinase, partial [Turicibacter sp.]|nr:thymidine kinase [Turicibacter sp.]
MGKLVLICGAMFAGKTTRLIAEAERYAKIGTPILYLKPSIDTRYSEDEIVTHDKIRVPASIIPNSLKDRYIVERADVILIDEVQFIEPHHVLEIVELVNEGKTIICAGLDLDYRTEA